MPSYYDEKQKTWYCKFYYVDWTGTKRQKKKRGFKLQRDAKEWERNFLERQQGQPDMTMDNLIQIYMEDTKGRMKPSTIYAKENRIQVHIAPYFGKQPINAITSAHVRKWQTDLMKKTGQTGQPLSPTYLNVLHHTLSSLFNYAVRYHGLQVNPCILAGSIGKSKSGEMKFWTLDEYHQFIAAVDHSLYRPIFETIYYTGMRVGELLALSFEDIDFDNGIIHVSKTLKRIGYDNIITTPKTAKSKRDILIPQFLIDELTEYRTHMYEPAPNDIVFPALRANILYNLKQYSKRAGVKTIRIHDLRHSHVALLIELGFNPLLIAERLGHEDIKTTLNTYSHLYPNKQIELVNRLQELVPN